MAADDPYTEGRTRKGLIACGFDQTPLEEWNLPAYQNIPTTTGRTLLSWAIQWKNPGALDLLMTNLTMESLPEASDMDPI